MHTVEYSRIGQITRCSEKDQTECDGLGTLSPRSEQRPELREEYIWDEVKYQA